jgi:hypothetical protein
MSYISTPSESSKANMSYASGASVVSNKSGEFPHFV